LRAHGVTYAKAGGKERRCEEGFSTVALCRPGE
jgi:hypothetical protein